MSPVIDWHVELYNLKIDDLACKPTLKEKKTLNAILDILEKRLRASLRAVIAGCLRIGRENWDYYKTKENSEQCYV